MDARAHMRVMRVEPIVCMEKRRARDGSGACLRCNVYTCYIADELVTVGVVGGLIRRLLSPRSLHVLVFKSSRYRAQVQQYH